MQKSFGIKRCYFNVKIAADIFQIPLVKSTQYLQDIFFLKLQNLLSLFHKLDHMGFG